VREEGPVDLLPCGRSLAGARAADPAALAETVTAVAAAYDRVVIDSPAGLRSDAGLPLYAAEACLLVTQPTRPAIADALRARELARVIETPLARVALNRVDPDRLAAGGLDRIASTLDGPVTPIPDSAAVARAQRAGQPVGRLAPDSRPARQFAELASQVRRAVEP
ncbi:chromosome partitioning protein ParA, partial [Halobacteriales archaeon QH_2_66_30]